jgi:Ca2+-binding EF-hand superfamily protein
MGSHRIFDAFDEKGRGMITIEELSKQLNLGTNDSVLR